MESPMHSRREVSGDAPKCSPSRESLSGGRDRCPTCGARRREETICSRCRADLSELVSLETRADRLYRNARTAYQAGFFRTAAIRAAAASRLEERPEFLRLAAVAALRAGDFLAAVRAARRVGE